ncbi:MAG: hypothetical protein ACFFE2_04870 [Candidatus Thorarchaeota archaeon]
MERILFWRLEMQYLEILQLLGDIVTVFGVLAGFSYYVLTVRGNRKSRQTEMFMNLYQTSIDSESYKKFWDLMSTQWEDMEDYMQKYGPWTHPDEAAKRMSQWSIYDGLGILVKENTVHAEMVQRMLGLRIIMMWLKFETIIKELRKKEVGTGPEYGPGLDFMENFEWLAKEMMRVRRQSGYSIPVQPINDYT